MRRKKNVLFENINNFAQNKAILMRVCHQETDDGKRPSSITVKTINYNVFNYIIHRTIPSKILCNTMKTSIEKVQLSADFYSSMRAVLHWSVLIKYHSRMYSFAFKTDIPLIDGSYRFQSLNIFLIYTVFIYFSLITTASKIINVW